ncbi:MAG TPA: disulfide bond formation protein B [Acetobacteraceae bacterium]|jgi:disulfide bond formation protein DsbB|nr:disulfide bond formation protein B [Acetobacteraceae bacterium]
MMVPRTRIALLIAAIAAAAAIAVAFGSEWYGGLVPCALCLLERWPYRIVLVLGLIGVILPRGFARLDAWLVVLVLLGGAAIAAVHVGVEAKAWPSPLPECVAPRITPGLSMAERLAAMPSKPSKSCEDATYLIPAVPVSFAAMNLIYALVLSGGLATFLWRSRWSGP